MTTLGRQDFSKIKEVVAGWQQIRQYLRGGDAGHLVPVVIPKDKRGYTMLFWFASALYLFATFALMGSGATLGLGFLVGLALTGLGAFVWWRSAIIEIEEGTTGILARSGQIVGTLPPGRRFLWRPWEKVAFIVDTSTEIPYTAPVLACPTQENVPLSEWIS